MSDEIWFGGGRMTIRVTSEQTDGAYVVIDDTMPKGKTTPLHLHRTFDETLFVLEGEILVHLDGEELVVGAGTAATVPRGVPHAFLVTSEQARTVGICSPGDVAERFFRAGGDPVMSSDEEQPPLDIPKVVQAGKDTGGMDVLGPPPFKT